MGPKRNQVAYIKPDEPAFLKRIKQQAGYKEGPNIDTKRETYPGDFSGDEDDDEYAEKEDEKPTIVVLHSGDLTAEEAAKAEEIQKKKEEQELIEKGKIVFKPQKIKRPSAQSSQADADTKKAKREESSSSRDVKNNKKPSLLSFEDEDE